MPRMLDTLFSSFALNFKYVCLDHTYDVCVATRETIPEASVDENHATFLRGNAFNIT